jgi:hypothetical protein
MEDLVVFIFAMEADRSSLHPFADHSNLPVATLAIVEAAFTLHTTDAAKFSEAQFPPVIADYSPFGYYFHRSLELLFLQLSLWAGWLYL